MKQVKGSQQKLANKRSKVLSIFAPTCVEDNGRSVTIMVSAHVHPGMKKAKSLFAVCYSWSVVELMVAHHHHHLRLKA